ncbi:MAG: histidinol-phosphatase HisJ family protein [Anaerovoracaceae bacterium]|jgi:histidinol-phosphatase (PHP family)
MFDMHSHTGFSDDCDIPIETMLDAAAASGIEGVAVTDHWDPGYPDPDFPFELDIDRYLKTLEKMRESYAQRGLTVLRGIEVGIMDSEMENTRERLAGRDFDLIIGSFHCCRSEALDIMDWSRRSEAEVTEDFYRWMYDCLRRFKLYNVVGHYTILDRYAPRRPDLTPCMDIIRETLKMMIEDGKGLEINTSNFKYHMDDWLPRREILAAYRKLGGEILTIGSDAHETDRYGDHFREAAELAVSLGFRWWCSFRGGEPVFHRFD